MSSNRFLPKDLLEFENKIILNSFLRRIKESVIYIFITEYEYIKSYNANKSCFDVKLVFNDFTHEEKPYQKDMVSEEFLNLLILNIGNIPEFLKIETKPDEKAKTIITLVNVPILEKCINHPNVHTTILKRKPYLHNGEINFLFLVLNPDQKYITECKIPLCEKDNSVMNNLPDSIREDYYSFIKTNLSHFESMMAFYKDLYNNLSDSEKLLVEFMEPNYLKY